MKREAVVIAIVGVVGAMLWTYGSMNLRPENWEPVIRRFPRPGERSTNEFVLTTGGRFALEIRTPATQPNPFRERPDVAADLQVTIAGPGSFGVNRRVIRFHNGGWTSNENQFFPDEVFTLPSGGRYRFTVTSRRPTPLFEGAEAVMTLRRFEPVGPDLGYELSSYVGMLLLRVARLPRSAWASCGGDRPSGRASAPDEGQCVPAT